MLITSSRLIPYRLPLTKAWQSARTFLRFREGWLLILETRSGQQGIGECAPLPDMGTELPGVASAWLTETLPALRGRAPGDLLLEIPSNAPSSARFGLETALLDLLCKVEGLPLHAWLTPKSATRIRVNAAVGALGERTAARITQASDEGHGVFKIKVGVDSVSTELKTIQRLFKCMNPQTKLRLDANGAWTPEDAAYFISGLDSDLVESLEEPLILPDPETLASLQAMTDISLALDESLPLFLRRHPVDRVPVRRIIVKPSVCGGIIRSLKIRRDADLAGIESVVTSTLESNIGILAAAHLAAATDGNTPSVHGLATGDWFARNTAPSPTVNAGRLQLPAGAGLGFSGAR